MLYRIYIRFVTMETKGGVGGVSGWGDVHAQDKSDTGQVFATRQVCTTGQVTDTMQVSDPRLR